MAYYILYVTSPMTLTTLFVNAVDLADQLVVLLNVMHLVLVGEIVV